MHAFATSSLCTTSNQYSVLATEDNTNSDASAICSRSSTPPLLSPITETSMHTTMDEGSNWLTQGTYTLLAALSHLGMDTSTTQVTNTAPHSDQSNTDGSVSVYLKNTCSTDIMEALRDLQYKCACIGEQHKEEDEEREQSKNNRADTKEHEAEKDACPGNGWIATTIELFTIPNDNGTFTQATFHKYHLANPRYPLISTTLEKGHPIYTNLLLPTPVPHKTNCLTPVQACIFSGREPFNEAVTYAVIDQEDEGLLATLHAYRQWEQVALFTKQKIICKQSQLAFQSIKMVEWKEVLCTTNAYKQIAKQMKNHVLWGTMEETAISEVIPHLKKKTYTHWERDVQGNKIGWEVNDHP